MQGRKPTMGTVLPMRPDGAAPQVDREKALVAGARRQAKKLMPKGLRPRVAEAWMHFGSLLCHPSLDRLRAIYGFAHLQLCLSVVLVEEIDEELAKAAALAKTSLIAVRIYRVKGRNGDQVKTHPLVVQRYEAIRELSHWMDEFGLTPSADLRIRRLFEAGQGDLFDPKKTEERNAIQKVSKYLR